MPNPRDRSHSPPKGTGGTAFGARPRILCHFSRTNETVLQEGRRQRPQSDRI